MKTFKNLLFLCATLIVLGVTAQVTPRQGELVKAVSIEEIRETSPQLLQRATTSEPIQNIQPPSGGEWGSSCYDASFMSNLNFFYVGQIEDPDNEIWFYFELEDYVENVSVSLCNSDFDSQLTVFDECEGELLGYNDDADCFAKNPEDIGIQSKIDFPYLEAGTYYILIQGNNGATGEFWLKVDADFGVPDIYITVPYLSETLPQGGTSIQEFLVVNFGSADLDFSLGIDYFQKNRTNPVKGLERQPKGEKVQIVPNGNSKSLARFKDAMQKSYNIFYDDMEFGLNGWITEDYTNNTANDLWHQTDQNYGSYNTSWWCADETTGTYETGERISNALISPYIDLTDVYYPVYLYFWENYDTEADWDFCMVDVSIDGGVTWDQLRGGIGSAPSGNSNGWLFNCLDLSSYAGFVIHIRFYFDTGDEVANDYSGWFIDDVYVSTNYSPQEWLSVFSYDYTVPPGWGYYVYASFDATGLSPGNYYANINISSNDPDSPLIALPVDLTVTDENSGASCEQAIYYGMINNPEESGTLDTNDEVWYSFDVFDYTPNVAISLCGSYFDTYLEVYSDCSGTLIASNDNYNCYLPSKEPGRSSLQSQVNFPLLAPGSYFVKISGATEDASFYVLNISQQDMFVPPSNLTADLNEETGEVTLNWDYYSTEVVFEDFEDGVADNFLFSDSRFSVADGYLKMNGTSTNSWASAYYDAIYNDFTLEFDFIRTQSDNTNASTIGAFIRSDGFMSYGYPVNGYTVAFTVSGYYSVWLQLNGAEYPVIPWTTTEFTNTVLGEVNSVMISASGNTIEIYLNGNYLNSFTDSYFVSGYVNLCTYDSNAGLNEVLFDNISLTPTSTKSLGGMEKVSQEGNVAEGTSASCNGAALTNPLNEPTRFNGEAQKSGNRSYSFTGFNIYRNGSWYTSTTSTSYVDNLPGLGTYDYLVTAHYYWGESSGVGPVAVTWTGVIMELTMPQGWSGVSSYLIPYDSYVEDLFEPMLSDLIILESDYGIYWPGENINTIVVWNTQSGYKVKVANSVQLSIAGVTEESKTLNLNAGWNLIPVLSECGVNVADFFTGHDVVIVKEVAGLKLYWPAMGINTLGTMEPGKSYYVMMSDFATITFPGCGGMKASLQASDPTRVSTLMGNNSTTNQLINNLKTSLDPSVFENFTNTPITHIIAIPGAVGNSFVAGDVIGAYDQNGKCFGIAVWQNGTTAITLFGNDPTTILKDGFDANELLTFRLTRNSTNTQYDLNFSFDNSFPNYDQLFVDNGLSVVSKVEMITTGLNATSLESQIKIVPNPAKNEFTLHLPDRDYASASVEIFKIDGQPMVNSQIVGREQKFDISQLPSGVYILQIVIEKEQFTRRLVKY